MNNLSTEVLVNIFSHLHLVQKLECLLVCRKWANILGAGYLFETIQVSASLDHSYPDNVNARRSLILRKSKSKGHPGKKCKRFLLHRTMLEGKINFVTLATTYPNLNFLSIGQDVWYKPFSKPPKEDQFEGWKNNLQVFECKGQKIYACPDLLKQGVFKRLSTLNIDPNSVGPNDYYYSQLFLHFGNLPALTHLNLHQFPARISQLEVLHKNAPGLISFTLCGSIHPEQVDLQSLNIKPAEKLTNLHIKKVYKNPKQPDILFEYIQLKYTHLNQFTHCEAHTLCPDFQRKELIETEWTQLLSTIGPGLKTCRITRAQYTEAIPDLLAKHTTQLENLSVSVGHSNQMLNVIVSENAYSNVNSLSLQLLPLDFKLSDLKMMTQLKELTLDLFIWAFKRVDISFNSIANDLPKSIKKLTMSHANLTVDNNDEELNQDSNITHLDISQSVLDDANTSLFLTRHLKKLYSLVLARCVMGHPIYLPNHHFGYAELAPVMQYMDSSNRLMCLQLTVAGKTQYFRRQSVRVGGLERMDHKDHRPLQQVLKGGLSKDSTVDYFHFTCASVDTAYFRYMYLLL
jgi:hypothetical protein